MLDPQSAIRSKPAVSVLIARINAASEANFVELVGPFVENAPWLVVRAAQERPFQGPGDLHCALSRAIRRASAAEKLHLLNCHPELAGREAKAGTMTEASVSEQNRLGLNRLEAETARRLSNGNKSYRTRFGFPFIIALQRQPDLDAVLTQLEQRLQAAPSDEMTLALEEVIAVIAGRLTQTFGPFTPTNGALKGD